MRKYIVLLACLVATIIFLNRSMVYAEDSPIESGFQAAYLYLGNSVNDDEHHGDFNELQGIANGDPDIGDPYWYFSRVSKILDNTTTPPVLLVETVLYSVHYAEHLKNDFTNYPKNVLFPGETTHCQHIGDLDYYVYNNKGYLLAGFDNCVDDKGYIGIFRADDLNSTADVITAHALLDVTAYQGNQVLWVCLDDDGAAYSGSGKEQNAAERNTVYKYPIENMWPLIDSLDRDDSRYLTSPAPTKFKLFFEISSPEEKTPFIKTHWQGADFSTDDSLFYFSEGDTGSGVLHVFDTSTGSDWNRIKRSKEPCVANALTCLDPDVYAAPFRFQVGIADEPEGLSYFDMNNVSSYHPDMPRSELHVILLHNDIFDDDNVHIKHYTGIVDISNSDSIADVYYHNPDWDEGIWDGAIMRLAPEDYLEDDTLLGKRVKIISSGIATIRGQ